MSCFDNDMRPSSFDFPSGQLESAKPILPSMTPLILALALAAQSPAVADSQFSTVVVRPNQSASWIAIRYLGAYSAAIRDTLKMDNPSIADLNLLKGGETLRLRRSMDRRKLSAERQIELASRQAVVTALRGQGELRRADGSTIPLSSNLFLSTGDEVRVGAGSSAELIIDNQSVLRLRENSRLRILGIQDEALANGRKAGTRVALDVGSLWVKVRTWAGPLVGFEVRLPTVIAGVHGTVFETKATADSSQTVSVFEGVVGVRTLLDEAREIKITRGQSVAVRPGAALEAPAAAPVEAPRQAPVPSFKDEFPDPDSSIDVQTPPVESRLLPKPKPSPIRPRGRKETKH